jgi:LysM repeat protein
VLKIPQSGSFPGQRALNPHPDTYTVKAGDTFASIACFYGDVSPEMIAFANSMSVTDKPQAGQVLNIP